jgi:UDP-3-O-[3-hydroxymyristoyl] glucosamine N-acyltransferase
VKEGDYKSTLILVEDAYLSFQVLMNLYQQMREEKNLELSSLLPYQIQLF